ncbi:MAG: FtsQ-type POTRA domain-containing protein [Ruminococcaceae bacterium]|nr:FtsQ-type POTRA domain-containing protein [Oscillospiraceae bacterium]
MKEGEVVPYKQNNAKTGRASRPENPRRRKEGYSKGNSSWNNSSYKQSVKTERTQTKVINTTPVRIRSDYFDHTKAGRRAQFKREYDRRRREWKAAVRKNVRAQKIKTALINTAAIFFAVVILFTAVYKLFFVANNIIIEGNSTYSAEDIISACGLDEKENLFSFSSREAADRIYFYCPGIKNADFERRIPDKVFINVEEEIPAFYAEIHGEVFTLSSSLRIMSRTDADTAKEAGLIKLKLQDVSYAVSGSVIELASSRAQRYLENTASLIEKSPLKGKLTSIDMTDDFKTVMVALGRYKLDFGSQDDLGVKLKLAEAILEDPIFNPENKAIIDLADTAKTSVIIDNQLELD